MKEGIDISRETDEYQFEWNSSVLNSIDELQEQHQKFENFLISASSRNSFSFTFDAKPFLDRPSSAIHLHFSFWEGDSNLLVDGAGDLASNSPVFLKLIRGWLSLGPRLMDNFCSCPANCRRWDFTKHEDRLFVPNAWDWGVNNRSAALRIIFRRNDVKNTRLEFRVPCSDVKVSNVLKVADRITRESLLDDSQMRIPQQLYGFSSKINERSSIVDWDMLLFNLVTLSLFGFLLWLLIRSLREDEQFRNISLFIHWSKALEVAVCDLWRKNLTWAK
jgi:Glutamine synthetase